MTKLAEVYKKYVDWQHNIGVTTAEEPTDADVVAMRKVFRERDDDLLVYALLRIGDALEEIALDVQSLRPMPRR